MTLRIAPFLLAAVAAAAVVPAIAQTPRPQPSSCAPDMAFVDPAGDQDLGFAVAPEGVGTGQRAPENHDILGGFFRYAPDATGRNVLTSNIVVSNLDKSVQPGATGALWIMRWTVAEVDYATMVEYDAETGALTATAGKDSIEVPRATTQVTLFEGKEGIVSVVIPVKDRAMEGVDGKMWLETQAATKVDFDSAAPTVDQAPEEAGGRRFRAIPCAEGDVATAVPATPAAPATLALKVVAGRLSARKANRARALTVGLDAGEPLSAISGRLMRGKKVFGSGGLRALSGKGRLRLRVPRKLKKGTYTLSISAKKADGRRVITAVQVRLR